MTIALQSILILFVLFGLLFLFKRKAVKRNELYFNLAIALAATFTGVYLALKFDSYQKDKETNKRLISILESSQTLWKYEVANYNWNYEQFSKHPRRYRFTHIFHQQPFQTFDPLKTILADGELYQKTSKGFRKYLPVAIVQSAEVDTLLEGTNNIDTFYIEQNFQGAASILEYLNDYIKNELQFLNGEKSEDSVNIFYDRLNTFRTMFLQKEIETLKSKYSRFDSISSRFDSLDMLISRVAKELPDSFRIPKTFNDEISHLSNRSVIYPDSIIRKILHYQKKEK